MDDPELAKIKASRMAQLQSGSAGGNNGPSAAEKKQMAEQQELMKNSILKQVLDQDAFGRLSNLAAVRPEKARAVENMVIQMARSGQLSGKLDDAGLRSLLDKVSAQQQKTTTVKFDRRRAALDSDDED
ncbi:Programmed cell death protein 5 [Aphelenchoides besseyi]|nr:Programmed cell death protein 5 [Aphelenchoides besseyi]KAI6208155.1 Programmed cell death protein 5 [Aphelenchoides besseyi]